MGILSGISSFVTTGKYWLIALAVVGSVSFAAGWYKGSVSSQKITATANATVTAGAAAAGAKVQTKQAASDAKANQQDSQKRATADEKRDNAAADIRADIPTLIPPTAPTVSAEAMDRLNDPDLIGEDVQ